MSHTPGPWRIASYGGRVVIEGGEQADTVCTLEMDADQAENAANASLIAAAPMMLAACRRIVLDSGERQHGFHCSHKSGGACDCAIQLARRAIWLANGGVTDRTTPAEGRLPD